MEEVGLERTPRISRFRNRDGLREGHSKSIMLGLMGNLERSEYSDLSAT